MSRKLVERVDFGAGVTAVVLNRAEKRNALNAALLGELADALRGVACDRECRVIVLAARGKVFCAGADVADPRLHPVGEPGSPEQLLVECQDLIGSASQPVIARVQGDVIGGGVGLVAATDIVVADQARRSCSTRHGWASHRHLRRARSFHASAAPWRCV